MTRKDMYISQIANWYEDKGEKISEVADEVLFTMRGFALTQSEAKDVLVCVREMLYDLNI